MLWHKSRQWHWTWPSQGPSLLIEIRKASFIWEGPKCWFKKVIIILHILTLEFHIIVSHNTFWLKTSKEKYIYPPKGENGSALVVDQWTALFGFVFSPMKYHLYLEGQTLIIQYLVISILLFSIFFKTNLSLQGKWVVIFVGIEFSSENYSFRKFVSVTGNFLNLWWDQRAFIHVILKYDPLKRVAIGEIFITQSASIFLMTNAKHYRTIHE